MGKKLVVAAFALVFIGAVIVYFQREEKKAAKVELSAKDVPHDKKPRMTAEEFVVYEYKDHVPTGTFSGKLAQFQDPDLLEIFGDVKGFSTDAKGHKESFSSETATVRFETKGLTELVKNSKIMTTTLENQVRFADDDVNIYTDYAKYDHRIEKLTSDRPVRVQNYQSDMLGHKGFEYDVKSQDVKIFGPSEGTVVDVPQQKH